MSFFNPKLNLKTKLNALSDAQEARFDFSLENHTPDYYFSASAVSSASDTITVPTDVIFVDSQSVMFESDTTLPSPLNNYTEYYIRNFTSGVSANTFQVSDTLLGAITDFTDSGSGTHQMKAIISVDDYRVVSYHNLRWDKVSLGNQTQGATGTSGTTNGFLQFDISDDKSFNTPTDPPRILPTDGKYSYRVRTKFGSGGEFVGHGSSFSGMFLRIRHQSSWNFIVEPSNGAYEYAPENSYSSTSASTYTDEPSFILEYNPIDSFTPGSSNWTRVTEYINTDTEDPNTGVYPYGDAIKDQTSTDHYAIYADYDTTIRSQAPNSNYGSSTALDLFSSVAGPTGDNRRPMVHYNVSGVSSGSVSKVESWLFTSNSNSTFDDLVDIISLSADFDESTATWNNSEFLFNGETLLTKDASLLPGDHWRDSYFKLDLPISAVQDWVDTPANNNGLGLVYQNEGTFTEVSPSFGSSEIADDYKKPLMVISYYGTSGGYDVTASQVNRNDLYSQMLNPEVNFSVAFSFLDAEVSASMVPVAFAGNPNTSAVDITTNVSAYMLEPNIGVTSGLPFDVSSTDIYSQMLAPTISVVFNQSADQLPTLVSAQMLDPVIYSEVILPTILFGVPTPVNKVAILPSGTITVRVDVSNHSELNYTDIGLTPNSLSGATIVSAWQIDPLSAAIIVEVSANDNIQGIIEVSAVNQIGTVAVSADSDYTFVAPTSAVEPVIIITNTPENKIIDPDSVIAKVQVLSPGFTPLNSFGLLPGSVGTIVSGGYSDPLIPFPNLNYFIEISATGNLYVSADDIYENQVSATDGIYVNYQKRYGVPCSGREIDLVNFLPNHLKVGEVGEFVQFFEDFLNNMYYCQNEFRGNPETSADQYKISILEKIFRLSYLHDADAIDLEYIQFFANYLGYDINISRGDIGNLANVDLTSVNTIGDDPNNDIYESELSRRYLRFAIRNLPTWYRIKTTRNAIKVMLFSFGLVGDILTNFTAPIEDGGYDNDELKWLTYDDRYADSSLTSQIPSEWFGTPHFSISVDYDNSPVNWFKQLPMIIDAIESIRPINTVLDEISATLKRRVYPIHVRAASRLNSTKYFEVVNTTAPIIPQYLIDNNGDIITDINGNPITYGE
jgi:hypothetical protein